MVTRKQIAVTTRGEVMYCIIQQVIRKKPNPYGEHREIEAYQNEWRIAGDDRPCTWTYRYTGGRFERPHLEAFKITLHQSYRESGKVKKQQYHICTMNYYDVVEWSLYDCADGRIQDTANLLGMDSAKIYEIIETKLEPLRERIEADWHQSAEYQAKQEHQRVLDEYQAAKSKFCKRYDVDGGEYDRCYDVFGVLRNAEYLEQIKAQHRARKESERRYRESWSSTYGQYSGGGYSVPLVSNYKESERAILKQFYRSLAKQFHPDVNHDRDTTADLQLLNRLKEQWGV